MGFLPLASWLKFELDQGWYDVDFEANEHVQRLQGLVQIDTTADRGREIDAARYLAGILEGAGIPTVVEEHVVRELLPRLVETGAQGIVEYPLNKIVG